MKHTLFVEVEDDDSGTEKKDEGSPKKTKAEINIGSEHIKKLEVRFLFLLLFRISFEIWPDNNP